MYAYLEVQRRILMAAYRRYLLADRALQAEQSVAHEWFPDSPSRKTMMIGNPGSRMRFLYEQRDRALARLKLARQALEDAQDRSSARSGGFIYLIELHRTPVS